MAKKKKEMTHSEFSSRGGKARAKKLSKERLSEIGREAMKSRWDRYRAQKAAEKEAAEKAKEIEGEEAHGEGP